MTILTSYGYGAFNAQRSDQTFRSLKTQLDDLQAQISTGKKASSYAGLGSAAAKSLSGRQTLSSIEAYASNVTDAQLRLRLMNSGIGQIDKIARSLSVSLSTSYETTPVGQTSSISSAEDGLKQILDILNTEVSGRSLYSGRATEVEPVADYGTIVNGDGTRAGLKQFVIERRAADLGTSGAGRVTTSTTATSITVAEEAAGLPFGMKIAGATATGTGLTAATSAGPPPSATLGVATQPAPGDKVTLSLRLPDGATTTLTLTASASASDDPNVFVIGATAAATATNLKGAVAAAVTRTATDKLPAASALGAAQAFFAGSPNNPPMRVAGPPYDTSVATVAGTPANTVIWYSGDDASGSARETAPVRVGESEAIAIGARANEPGFQKVLAALGALVAQDFPAGDVAARQRYTATTEAIADSIGEGVQSISADFAIASKRLDSAKERLGIAKAQVEDAIGVAEDADPNEVAVKLLATQTRLQASYQTTSVISKLSLVNFI